MRRRAVTFGAGAAAIAGAMLSFGPGWAASAAASQPWGGGETEVVDQDGRRHRFYADLIMNRVAAVNFFYTGCAEVCPLVTQNLREVQDLLGDRMGGDIFLYSVSLQPELETPAVLKAYADQWQVRPGWKFLTGRPSAVEGLRRAMGFASPDPDYDRVKDNHTGIVRYGNDRVGRWSSTPGLGRPAWIATALAEVADIA